MDFRWRRGHPIPQELLLGLVDLRRDLAVIAHEFGPWDGESPSLLDLGRAFDHNYAVLRRIMLILCTTPEMTNLTLLQFPWQRLVEVVYTRCGDCSAQNLRGQRMDSAFSQHDTSITSCTALTRLLMVQTSLDDPEFFAAQMLAWINSNCLAKASMDMLFAGSSSETRESYRDLSRPGAWLLDSMWTVHRVSTGRHASSRLPRYLVVDNRTLWKLARLWLPTYIAVRRPLNSAESRTDVGNHVEYLACLALECDLCELIIAMVYHCDQIDGIEKGVEWT
mmetsp:Transcript_62631/g.174578  ORF Transcript_62631/g.174578 Transcript_62631/m.174578 type:complete len:279 (-) Transcript_62631:48-884(-)